MNEKQCCKPYYPPMNNQNDNLAYALYYQTGMLVNGAPFDGVTLAEVEAETRGSFFSDGSTFQILKPGVYLATYMIHIPAAATVDTTFALQVNRQNADSTVRTVTKTAVDTPVTVTAQTIIEADTPVALRLSSSNLVSAAGIADETVASLSIVQLAACN